MLKLLTNVHESARETRPLPRPRHKHVDSNAEATRNSTQADQAAWGSVRDLEQPLDNLLLSASQSDVSLWRSH